MEVVDLEAVRENLEFMLESFRELPTPKKPDIEYAEACLLAWRRERQLALATLLTDATSGKFFEHLARAAEIRRDFLAFTSGELNRFAEYRHVGDTAGFVAALAAGESTSLATLRY